MDDKSALYVVISSDSGEGQVSDSCDHGSKSSPFVKTRGIFSEAEKLLA
jgi:hypothetical protein